MPVSQIQEQVIVQEIPQVVVCFLPLQEFVAPMCNQVLQERIVATIQPHGRFREIPEWWQDVERIKVSQTTLYTSSTSTSSGVLAAIRVATATPTPVDAQVFGSFLHLQDFAAPVYNQIHQGQIVGFQQCTIAPISQDVTREHFQNDTEHSSRRKVRFATEDDV